MTTTVIRNLESEIKNPVLKPIYIPFNAVSGAIAAFRGRFDTDLTGNGNATSQVGAPTFTEFGILCNKAAGLLTSVADRTDITLVVTYRQPASIPAPNQSYLYPVGNLAQNNTTTGVGVGIIHSAAAGANITQHSGVIGANSKTDGYLGIAKPATRPEAASMNWTFVALAVNGTANAANLYVPQQSTQLVPATLSSGANLANRSLLENGLPSFMRIGCWRDGAQPTAASYAVEVAEVLFFDRALSKPDLDQEYLNRKAYLQFLGQDLV